MIVRPLGSAGLLAALAALGIGSTVLSSGNHGPFTSDEHHTGVRTTHNLLRNLGVASEGLWDAISAFVDAGLGSMSYTRAPDGFAATFWAFVMTEGQRRIVRENPSLTWSVSLVRSGIARSRICYRRHLPPPSLLPAVCTRGAGAGKRSHRRNSARALERTRALTVT